MLEAAKVFHEIGDGITVRADGQVVCCIGVYAKNGWSAEAWALFARRAMCFALPLVRLLRRGIPMHMAEKGYKRLEMNVHADQLKGNRLAVMLGFRYEGPLYCYSPNGDTFNRFSFCRR